MEYQVTTWKPGQRTIEDMLKSNANSGWRLLAVVSPAPETVMMFWEKAK